MAPRVGFEPTTLRLTAGCSAVELPRNLPNTCVLFERARKYYTHLINERKPLFQIFSVRPGEPAQKPTRPPDSPARVNSQAHPNASARSARACVKPTHEPPVPPLKPLTRTPRHNHRPILRASSSAKRMIPRKARPHAPPAKAYAPEKPASKRHQEMSARIMNTSRTQHFPSSQSHTNRLSALLPSFESAEMPRLILSRG